MARVSSVEEGGRRACPSRRSTIGRVTARAATTAATAIGRRACPVAVARSAAEAARQSDVLTNSTSAERFTAQHGLAITTIDLPTVPFWKLLAQNGFTRVDLMTVDVEGDEEAVIRSIDFRRVDIRLLVVERPSERLVAFLLAAGFVERTGEIVKPIATGQGLGDRVFLGAREAQEVHGRGPPARAGGRGRRPHPYRLTATNLKIFKSYID